MSKARLFVALAVVMLLVIVVLRQESAETASTSPSPRASITSSKSTEQPQLPSVAGRSHAKHATPSYLAARGTAIGQFQAQLMQYLGNCAPTSTAPQPRAVQFIFERDDRQSTPGLQLMIVRDVNVIDIGGLAPRSRECVEQTLGMPLMLAVAADQLPSDAGTFSELLHVPLS